MLTHVNGDNFYLSGALGVPSFKYMFSAFIHAVLYVLNRSRVEALLYKKKKKEKQREQSLTRSRNSYAHSYELGRIPPNAAPITVKIVCIAKLQLNLPGFYFFKEKLPVDTGPGIMSPMIVVFAACLKQVNISCRNIAEKVCI